MSLDSPSVLLIDDEEALLLGVAEIMKRAGYQVLTAGDGATGLHLARAHQPDLIICDVMMPSPNGFELRQLLSNAEETRHIPFIFLSARASQSDKLQGLKTGADDYITKPFDRQELLLRAEALLRRTDHTRQRAWAEAETQMSALRREVVKNVSHELRTPLAQVLGVLELAVTNKFSDPGEQSWFIEAALSSARSLHQLVEDLITLTHIDQDQLSAYRQQLELEFDFHGPIYRTQERYVERKLDVRVKVSEPFTGRAPRLEFKQAVLHLMDNALKFSPSGGRVDVTLNSLGRDGLVLTVSDDGPGVPAPLRQKVFERFYQVSQGNTRAFGGLGVGLHIARHIARKLDGDVEILDTSHGCTVQMRVPATTDSIPST